jgi:hypothetical protein
MKKRITALLLVSMLLSAVPLSAQALQVSGWARDEAAAFFDHGLMPEQLADRDFRQPITRLEFCTLVMHAYPKMTEAPVSFDWFQELPFDDSFDGNVMWAHQLGIVSGTGERQFTPDRIITREEIARMFHNLLDLLEPGPERYHAVLDFDDACDIPSWAAESVSLLVELKIMQGNGKRFLPKETATFEQVSYAHAQPPFQTAQRLRRHGTGPDCH